MDTQGTRSVYERSVEDDSARSLEEDRRMVMRWALRHTRNPHDAEDLTQDVLVKSITRGHSIRPGAYNGWLYRVTTNLYVDRVRRRNRVRFETLPSDADHLLRDDAVSPETEVLRGSLEPSVAQALLSLAEDHRNTIVLRDVHELTYDEIAELMNVPTGTVRSRIHRGRRRLRESIVDADAMALAA